MPPARLPGRGVLDALHPLVLEDEGPPRRGGVDRVQYEVDAIDVKGSADPFWGLTEAGGSFSRSRLRTLIPYCLYVLYVRNHQKRICPVRTHNQRRANMAHCPALVGDLAARGQLAKRSGVPRLTASWSGASHTSVPGGWRSSLGPIRIMPLSSFSTDKTRRCQLPSRSRALEAQRKAPFLRESLLQGPGSVITPGPGENAARKSNHPSAGNRTRTNPS